MGSTATVDIYTPDWYLTDQVHDTFTRLRDNERVVWQDIPGDAGYWAVLTHADVVTVARDPQRFSASLGSVMLETLDPETLERMRHMLLVMDPPQHLVYRRPLAPHFLPAVVGRMTEQIRVRCRAIMERAAEQGEVDFVHDVAGPLQPRRDDLTSLLLETTFDDGQPMSDLDYGSFFVQLVTAGNDTTKTVMSSGVYELVRRPDRLAALRRDPTLIPVAVEEMLRYCNPLHCFRRTATTDTELGGKRIAAGDKVAMMYTAANRDPAVFTDPQTFDIRRSPNPHLSFGIGEHFCLGVHLARLEIRVFLEELLASFATIEPTGAPVKIRSNLNNGYKRMPMRLARS